MDWDDQPFHGLIPVWKKEPDVAIIQKLVIEQLHLDPVTAVDVKFLAEGSCNRVYKVDAQDKCYAFRAILPILPRLKTLSEIATSVFAHENTKLPVPKVLAYDSTSDNELGYEYMLMEFVTGTPLIHKFRHMPWEKKCDLTRRLARAQYELTRPSNCFSELGSIYIAPNDPAVSPGTLTSPTFGVGISTAQDIWRHRSTDRQSARGPYTTVSAWLRDRIACNREEREWQIAHPDPDEEDDDEAERDGNAKQSIAYGELLESKLDEVFSPTQDTVHRAVVQHQDLGSHNILVDDHCNMLAVIDWEMATTVPLAFAHSCPKLIEVRKDREEKPDRNNFGDYNPEVDDYEDFDLGDNDGKCNLYWERVDEWERTQLKKVWADEMRRLTPEYDALQEERQKIEEWDQAILMLEFEPFAWGPAAELLYKLGMVGRDDRVLRWSRRIDGIEMTDDESEEDSEEVSHGDSETEADEQDNLEAVADNGANDADAIVPFEQGMDRLRINH